MKIFLGNSLWNLIAQSDAMTKWVLVIVLFGSVICWTITFYKLILLSTKRKQLDVVAQGLKKVETLDTLVAFTAAHSTTYPAYLLIGQLTAAKSLLQRPLHKETIDPELQLLDESRFSCLDDMGHVENSYLSILSLSAAAGPLLGLFGTVWGLTHSFISISQKQTADILTIAPGLAEALLTTVAGLVVAIPAIFMYHYFSGCSNEIDYKLNKISEKVHTIICRAVLDKLVTGKDAHEIPFVQQETTKQTIVSGS